MFGEEKEMIQNLDLQECMSLGRISQMSSSLRTIVQQRLNLPMPLDEDISHVLCLTCRTPTEFQMKPGQISQAFLFICVSSMPAPLKPKKYVYCTETGESRSPRRSYSQQPSFQQRNRLFQERTG